MNIAGIQKDWPLVSVDRHLATHQLAFDAADVLSVLQQGYINHSLRI
jgi:hypothetical protein